jgi:hypothetical protein
MALLSRNKPADNLTDEARIPDPRDDPDYARALDLLTAFNRRFDRLEKEKQRLSLEVHFVGRSTDKDSSNDAQLRLKLKALRAEPPLKPMQPDAPAAPSTAIAAGIKVLQGEPVTRAPGYTAQISDIDGQLAVLGAALREQTEICDELLGRQIEICAMQVLPRWNSMVLEMYRDAQTLSRTTSKFRTFRAHVMEKGIRTETLRNVNVISPLQLGAEEDWQSEISHWRRTLEAWGLLP